MTESLVRSETSERYTGRARRQQLAHKTRRTERRRRRETASEIAMIAISHGLFTRCLHVRTLLLWSRGHSLRLCFIQAQMTLQSRKRRESMRRTAHCSFSRLNRYMRLDELSPHRHLRTCIFTLGSPRSLRFFSFSCRLLKPSSLGSSSPTADDRPSNMGEMSTFHNLYITNVGIWK